MQLNRKKKTKTKKPPLLNKPNQPKKNKSKEKGKRCCLATASFKWSEIGVFAGIWEISHRACQGHRIRKEKNQCPKWRREPLLCHQIEHVLLAWCGLQHTAGGLA